MRLFTLLFLSLVCPAAFAAELKVGDAAPPFEAKDDTGAEWKSSDHVGKNILVVYFYPADMTGGCTAQACGYRDKMETLSSSGVKVIGVSGDSVENHQVFKKAHDLNFTLLADSSGEVAKQFGVPVAIGEKTVKKLIAGIDTSLVRSATTKRWTFVIDRDGKIAYKDAKVKAKADPEKIVKVIKTLE